MRLWSRSRCDTLTLRGSRSFHCLTGPAVPATGTASFRRVAEPISTTHLARSAILGTGCTILPEIRLTPSSRAELLRAYSAILRTSCAGFSAVTRLVPAVDAEAAIFHAVRTRLGPAAHRISTALRTCPAVR